MNSLLLYFMMFYLLKVSSAEMTVCKIVSYDNEPEYNQQSFIFIEKENLKKEHKGINETKGEKGEIGEKGEKGDVCQINQTEINQMKSKITSRLAFDLN